MVLDNYGCTVIPASGFQFGIALGLLLPCLQAMEGSPAAAPAHAAFVALSVPNRPAPSFGISVNR